MKCDAQSASPALWSLIAFAGILKNEWTIHFVGNLLCLLASVPNQQNIPSRSQPWPYLGDQKNPFGWA